jgi:two-component system OmpR family sensor kinase
MTSLRTRLLAGVLLLSAAGLVALAAITYTEQRSFLEGRVDQEVRGAAPALTHVLDGEGSAERPPVAGGAAQSGEGSSGEGGGGNSGEGSGGEGGESSGEGSGGVGSSGEHGGGRTPRGGGLPGEPPGPNLPPGTYGQRVEPSGRATGSAVLIGYGQAALPAPRIPSRVPIEKLFTVGSAGSSGLRYRVYVTRDPQDAALTLAAVPLREVDQTLSHLLLVEALEILGILVALGLTAFFVVRLGLRPLDRMEVTAGEIAAGELSRRVSPATARTEVGRLGLALNAMLERLERAFAQRQASEERLRRFLADASHELRTPLASIRGYAELFRMGATRDEAGTRLAMRRIEEESERMGLLVEDLLALARLDEAPGLRRETVDLAALARDAVQDARATAPERSIALGATGPAVLSGDAHRLRQVLANLLRNALVHTPERTPIEVAVEQDSEHVTVSVRDHGPGLPDGAPELLFDRFWRAEGGRERGKGGAGLGLAIVAGVVAAHSGEVSAANAPGGGALFVVRLPRSTTFPT